MRATITFSDPIVAKMFEVANEEIATHGEARVKQRIDENRWSEKPIERVEAATAYSALGFFYRDCSQFGDAAVFFHFAGHAFRTVWMEAKAAKLYMLSADCGVKFTASLLAKGDIDAAANQREFDLRSLGRAVMAFRQSGQFERCEDAAQQRQALLEAAKLQ